MQKSEYGLYFRNSAADFTHSRNGVTSSIGAAVTLTSNRDLVAICFTIDTRNESSASWEVLLLSMLEATGDASKNCLVTDEFKGFLKVFRRVFRQTAHKYCQKHRKVS